MASRGILALVTCALAGASIGCADGGPNAGKTLQGAGATFPAPIYQRWFADFSRAHPQTRVNYQPLGSGAGVQHFIDGLVDFGASDAAMTDDEIAKVDGGVVLLPLTAGSVVLAYNLPEAGDGLKLSRAAYAGIFLGQIARWNDPRIAAENPGAALPDAPITVVRRADGSGTTYVLSNHLAAISPAWRDGPGVGKSIDWPTGLGAKGNQGVAALVQQTPGAIGYVEYGFSIHAKLPTAVLENAAGNYVPATTASGQAALASADMPDDLRVWIPDPSGPDAYPIVTYTWLLCRPKYNAPETAAAIQSLVEYCATTGQASAESLGYIPLPSDVVDRVVERCQRIASIARPATP